MLIHPKELPAVSSPPLVTVQWCHRIYMVLVLDKDMGLLVVVAGVYLVKK